MCENRASAWAASRVGRIREGTLADYARGRRSDAVLLTTAPGLDDFGDDSFREGFEILARSPVTAT
jgi:hypothetical protein